MRIRIPSTDFPELASFNDTYRQAVLQRAELQLRRDWPFLRWLPIFLCCVVAFAGSLGGSYLCSSMFGGDRSERILLSTCGSLAGVLFGGLTEGFVGATLFRYRLHSSVRRILLEDELSISHAA